MREYRGIHPYQDVIADGCAVNDGAVTQCALFADGKGCIGVDVQRAIVLDVGAAADDYGGAVSAHDGVVPDACPCMYGDVADDHRAGGDEDVVSDGGPGAVIR